MTALAARVELDKESPEFAAGAAIHGAIQDYAAAVVLAEEVDPIITELVRLRCSGVHDCRLCGSLRVDRALEQGFDERMAAEICLDVVKWSEQKQMVSLRIEPPAGDELKVLIFDAEGAPIIGDTV